jgi:arylsulfatase A-like enzyme
VRADHLSVYGYGRPTTPNLERFAAEGVVFDRCFTPIPWTVGAHMSLFTALYPTVHTIAHLEPQAEVPRTLPQALQEAGYRTGAFVHPILDAQYGFARGFDHYFRPASDRRAESMTRRALRWLEEGERGENAARPFFLFLHLYDAHHAYAPPPPFDTAFVAAYDADINQVVGAHPYNQDKRLTAEQLAQAVALYDGEIRYLDHVLGDFFQRLRDLGVFEGALVVVLADHGEGFLEHGLVNHGNSVYEELIRVPLLVRFPGGRPRGQRPGGVVELTDVAPTVLEAARARALPAMQGRSLRALVAGGEAAPERSAYASGAFASSLRSRDWKLIENPPSRFRTIRRALPAEYELYDLRHDPGERHNLAAARPQTVEAMARALRGLDEQNRRLRQGLRAGRDASPLPLTDEQRERLRALGYVE